MLSLFPQLLFLSPVAIALLRIVAALYFFYIAYSVSKRKNAIISAQLPLIGHAGEWLVWFSSTVTLLIAVMLLVGVYTQVAAIAGTIIALKYVLFVKKYPEIIALPRSTSLLLLAICVALIATGAGAVAFDLPL